MDIDYERLKLIVLGDLHPSERDNFDIDTIVNNATLDDGVITVKSHVWWFKYDANTYEQLGGGGGGIADE